MSEFHDPDANISAGPMFETIHPTPPGAITFTVENGKVVLIMRPDGRVERGEGFATDDEASMALFDAMSKCLPTFLSDMRSRAETAERKLASDHPVFDAQLRDDVVHAACKLIASDINVHPMMSREEAVASGYAALNTAVDRWTVAQPANQTVKP